jgi:hypothetical protein
MVSIASQNEKIAKDTTVHHVIPNPSVLHIILDWKYILSSLMRHVKCPPTPSLRLSLPHYALPLMLLIPCVCNKSSTNLKQILVVRSSKSWSNPIVRLYPSPLNGSKVFLLPHSFLLPSQIETSVVRVMSEYILWHAWDRIVSHVYSRYRSALRFRSTWTNVDIPLKLHKTGFKPGKFGRCLASFDYQYLTPALRPRTGSRQCRWIVCRVHILLALTSRLPRLLKYFNAFAKPVVAPFPMSIYGGMYWSLIRDLCFREIQLSHPSVSHINPPPTYMVVRRRP